MTDIEKTAARLDRFLARRAAEGADFLSPGPMSELLCTLPPNARSRFYQQNKPAIQREINERWRQSQHRLGWEED